MINIIFEVLPGSTHEVPYIYTSISDALLNVVLLELSVHKSELLFRHLATEAEF